jgi:hypothetical protein
MMLVLKSSFGKRRIKRWTITITTLLDEKILSIAPEYIIGHGSHRFSPLGPGKWSKLLIILGLVVTYTNSVA